jgi:cell division septum initiation protein DivIVA
MSRTDPPRTRTNPQDLRRKNFTVRLRGFDQDEIRFFMAGLADQLEGIQTQVATLTQENQTLTQENQTLTQENQTLTQENQLLRSELSETEADPMELATDQAVSVLNQAQQLADSLIDEAMQSARDLLLTARSQQRDVMEQAQVAAKGAVNRATAIAERAGSEDGSVRDIEYIRMFVKVAQVQFQAVLDALNEHVNRLDEAPGIAEHPKSDSGSKDFDRAASTSTLR